MERHAHEGGTPMLLPTLTQEDGGCRGRMLSLWDWLEHPPRLILLPMRGFGQVIFCNSFLAGALILVGLFAGDPWLATLSVAASLTATLTAYAARLDKAFVDEGLCSYNAVLFACGTSVFLGYDAWTWQPAVWAVLGGVFMPFVSMAMARLSDVPAWTWGFNFCMLAVLLRVQPLAHPGPPPDDAPQRLGDLEWWEFAAAVPRGISQIYVVNDWIAGLLIIAGLAAQNCKLSGACVVGSALGLLTGMALGDLPTALRDGLCGYNPALTAAAVVVFFEPTKQSVVLIVLGSVFTQVLASGMNVPFGTALKVPDCTLPFCVAATLIFTLRDSVPGLRRPGAPPAPLSDLQEVPIPADHELQLQG